MAPKVTVQTPTDQVLASTSTEITVTDAKGRAIGLKKPGVLAQYRLVEMVGESAKNEVYMGMILPLIYVTTIDGDPVCLGKKSELEALIQRLEEAGIGAVMAGVQEHFGVLPDPEATKAALKKS